MPFIQLKLDINEVRKEEIETMLNSFCGIVQEQLVPEFTFGILNNKGDLKFYLYSNDIFLSLLKKKINSIYPEIEYETFTDNKELFNDSGNFCKLALAKKSNCKIKTEGLENIFINDLINIMYRKDNSFISLVEISIQPEYLIKSKNNNIGPKITKGFLKCIQFALDSIFYDDRNYVANKQKNEKLQETVSFNYNMSIKIATNEVDTGGLDLKNIAYTFSQLNNENIFKIKTINHSEMFNRNDYNIKLSTKEMSQFIVFPTNKMLDNIIGCNETKNLIDKNVPSDGIIIGHNNNSDLAIPFPIKGLAPNKLKSIYKQYSKVIDDICKPKLCLGLQGTGKSEWTVNYAIACVKLGIPVIILDPKNDTQKRFIESLPEEYIDQVDYVDLGDLFYPPALNIFRKRSDNDATENSLLVTNFISYMKKQFGSSWGFRIQEIIQMTTEAILLEKQPTLSEFLWMLTEKDYREYIIGKMHAMIDDPDIKGKSQIKKLLKYWEKFNEKPDKIIEKDVEPTLNKIGVFLGNRFINSIVSQGESYDFRKSGDMGRSVVINLPEGIINEENMSLLSGFLNKAIWIDYQSRDNVELDERYPVMWIIDEAHTIVDDDFIGVLTKSRSRRLGILLITQAITNFDMRGAKMSSLVADNCKTKILFRIGYGDARTFVDEFAPLSPSDLNNCLDCHFYAKILLENGSVSKPFFAETPPMASKVRDYDEFKKSRRVNRLTIDEIEDSIDERLQKIKDTMEVARTLSM